MILKLLRLACSLCVLSTFWSVARVFDISIFEWLAAMVVPTALLCRPHDEGVSLSSFKLAGAGLAILTLAGIISSQSSFDASEHLIKVFKLVGAYGLMLGLAYVLTTRKILSTMEILNLLAISAAVCSGVAILQGQFGLLTQVIPREAGASVEAWTRMTGLAEHPIEAGVVSAYGFIVAIGMALLTRRWRVFIVMMAIDAYAMRYSASLTAFFAFVLAAVLFCFYTKEYKILIAGATLGAVTVAAVVIFASNTAGLLSNRLATLYSSAGNYQTVQSRELQLQHAIDMIDPSTLAVGNGYSSTDLPYKMEIHNGFVASVFHFGLLGLISQCCFIAFFVTRLASSAPRPINGILLACTVVFALAYVSGPAQARPSLWAPLLLLGASLGAPRRAGATVTSSLDSSRFALRPTIPSN